MIKVDPLTIMMLIGSFLVVIDSIITRRKNRKLIGLMSQVQEQHKQSFSILKASEEANKKTKSLNSETNELISQMQNAIKETANELMLTKTDHFQVHDILIDMCGKIGIDKNVAPDIINIYTERTNSKNYSTSVYPELTKIISVAVVEKIQTIEPKR